NVRVCRPQSKEPVDCNRSRPRPHSAERPKNLTQRVVVIVSRGRRLALTPSMGEIAADVGMPAGNDVETGYGGSSEVARFSQGRFDRHGGRTRSHAGWPGRMTRRAMS